jgi:pyruvate/2-oxoglutarate dehydrogenase complex dihydrolipoamide acyltransferase (E2) component
MTLLPVLLPEGFSLKVSAGDRVTAGQVLAEGQGQVHEEIIHLAHELKLVPQKALNSLKKNLGDSVAVGEVLAAKKTLLSTREIVSKFSGTIVKIDEESGDLILRVSGVGQNLKTITSPVAGTVDSCNNQKVVLKTDKEAILALDGVGQEAEGEIEYLADSDEAKLDAGIKGKILLTKAIDKLYVFKTIGLEAAGIITQGLEGIDFVDLEEKQVKMPVLQVNEEDFKKLAGEKDKKIYLFGKNKSIIIL